MVCLTSEKNDLDGAGRHGRLRRLKRRRPCVASDSEDRRGRHFVIFGQGKHMMVRGGLVRGRLPLEAAAEQRAGAAVRRAAVGKYLVNTIMTARTATTPKGASAGSPVFPERDSSSGLSWDEPPFKVTRVQHHAGRGDRPIGSWTDGARSRQALRKRRSSERRASCRRSCRPKF